MTPTAPPLKPATTSLDEPMHWCSHFIHRVNTIFTFYHHNLGLRPSSQSSVSVASLDLENKLEAGEEDKEKEKVEEDVVDKEGFVVDWIACLQEIDNLIETTSQIFR